MDETCSISPDTTHHDVLRDTRRLGSIPPVTTITTTTHCAAGRLGSIPPVTTTTTHHGVLRMPEEMNWKKIAKTHLISYSKRCMHSKNTKIVAAVIMGQVLSILLCGTGVTTQLLVSKHSTSVPTTQAFINYVLLGLVYGVMVAARKDFLTILRKNWWKYIILGVVDVEANYLIILAYKYTNLTTVQLLDSFTIVSVMILSFILLRARYKIINYMGVSLSLVGILSLVLADSRGSRAGRGSDPLKGDLLCLGGTLLYAISNVAQEFLVKNHSITEYLGFIGVSGSIVSAIQLYVLERKDLVKLEWNTDIGLLFLGFGVCLFIFYSIVPYVMKFTSAVVVNLSLLTADFYTLLFGLLLFHYKFSLFYLLAFVLIIAGVFIYNLRLPSTSRKMKKKENNPDNSTQKTRGEVVVSVLRRALFESRTYEISSGKESTLPKDPYKRRSRKSATRHMDPCFTTIKSNSDPGTLASKPSSSRVPSQLAQATESLSIKKKSNIMLSELESDHAEEGGLVSSTQQSSSRTSEGASSYGSLDVQISIISREEIVVQAKPPIEKLKDSSEIQPSSEEEMASGNSSEKRACGSLDNQPQRTRR